MLPNHNILRNCRSTHDNKLKFVRRKSISIGSKGIEISLKLSTIKRVFYTITCIQTQTIKEKVSRLLYVPELLQRSSLQIRYSRVHRVLECEKSDILPMCTSR